MAMDLELLMRQLLHLVVIFNLIKHFKYFFSFLLNISLLSGHFGHCMYTKTQIYESVNVFFFHICVPILMLFKDILGSSTRF